MKRVARRNTLRPLVVFVAAWCAGAPLQALGQRAAQAAAQLQAWGFETLEHTQATLAKPDNRALYAEFARADGQQDGGMNGHCYVWPLSTQLRALVQATAFDADR